MNRYYRRATRRYRVKLSAAVSVLCFGGLSLGVLTDYTILAAIVLGFGVYILIGFVIELLSEPWCSIHPYFEKALQLQDGYSRTFMSGANLARHLDEFDQALADSKARTISSFGFRDSHDNAHSLWYEPRDGLITFLAALEVAAGHPHLAETVDELTAIVELLRVAEKMGARFCLHMRVFNGVSMQEFDVREGFYY